MKKYIPILLLVNILLFIGYYVIDNYLRSPAKPQKQEVQAAYSSLDIIINNPQQPLKQPYAIAFKLANLGSTPSTDNRLLIELPFAGSADAISNPNAFLHNNNATNLDKINRLINNSQATGFIAPQNENFTYNYDSIYPVLEQLDQSGKTLYINASPNNKYLQYIDKFSDNLISYIYISSIANTNIKPLQIAYKNGNITLLIEGNSANIAAIENFVAVIKNDKDL